MVETVKGDLKAEGYKFGIIASRFNNFIVKGLIDGALESLEKHGADESNIKVFRVPGAFEIPGTAKRLYNTGEYDALICLGALLKGDTPHFEYLSAEVTKGIAQISVKGDIPVSYGIITTTNLEQAIERAGSKSGNKGEEAALSVIEMLNLYDEIG